MYNLFDDPVEVVVVDKVIDDTEYDYMLENNSLFESEPELSDNVVTSPVDIRPQSRAIIRKAKLLTGLSGYVKECRRAMLEPGMLEISEEMYASAGAAVEYMSAEVGLPKTIQTPRGTDVSDCVYNNYMLGKELVSIHRELQEHLRNDITQLSQENIDPVAQDEMDNLLRLL